MKLYQKIVCLSTLSVGAVICGLNISTANESSEDNVSPSYACSQSVGVHFGKFYIPEEYNVQNKGTYFVTGKPTKLYFTDYSSTQGDSANLYSYDCATHDAYKWSTINAPADTQISPEVDQVKNKFILLGDWENTNGKSYYTNTLIDLTTGDTHRITLDTLKASNKLLASFVGDESLGWKVRGYHHNKLTISITKTIEGSSKTKIFSVKLK